MFCSHHSNLFQSRNIAAKSSCERGYSSIGGNSRGEFIVESHNRSNCQGQRRFATPDSDLSQQEKNQIGYDWLNYNGSLTAAEPKRNYRSGRDRLLIAVPQ
jgi:hypothetical protein